MAFFTFISNAHKSKTRESTTRLQTSYTILFLSGAIIAVLIMYARNPILVGEHIGDILWSLVALWIAALTGKVVSGRNEQKLNNDFYDDFEKPNSNKPYTDVDTTK